MGKKQAKHKCEYASFCGREFDSARGLSIHKTRSGHWGKYTPPAPPKPPEKKHKNYADLVRGTRSWGRSMTAEEIKHPSLEELKLGALFRIVEILEDLSAHLGLKK